MTARTVPASARRRIALALTIAFAATAMQLIPADATPGHGRRPAPRLVVRTTRIGTNTFEPTIGAAPNGDLYYSVTPGAGVAIGFSAGVYRSEDHGRTWTDVTPHVGPQAIPPETNDPFIYTDPYSGRVFEFHMGPILSCSVMSWSDDRGATWTTNPRGCGVTGVWDHQTMVALPPTEAVVTVGYPDVLVQCVNAVYADMCARSLDGGLTWTDGVPAYLNEHADQLCGSQSGHLAAAPDSTVYLPSPQCSASARISISRDQGLTWENHDVNGSIDSGGGDPAIDVDANGNVHVVFADEKGRLYYTRSRDEGRTWTKPIPASPKGITVALPALAAGDSGKIAFSYVGTPDLPDGFGSDITADEQSAMHWNGYLAMSVDALRPIPHFQTVRINPASDPLMRGGACPGPGGRCAYQVDFIDIVIGVDGRPYAAFVDGCSGPCTKKGGSNNEPDPGPAIVATLSRGPLLRTPRE